MNKHPFLNALAAEAYIALFASGIWITGTYVQVDPPMVLAATFFLSMFVFSAACMGYIILSTPILYILEGERTKGIRYFLHTLGYFALLAAVTGVLILPFIL